MKKISAALGLALVSLTLFSSCTKSDYNSGSGQTGYNPFYTKPPVTFGTFTAKVNGYDYFADISMAMTSNSLGLLSISGAKNAAAPEAMMLAITGTDAVAGTYTVGSGGVMIMYTPAGGATGGLATSGTVVIDSRDDKRVKGTFNFKLEGIDVTEGKFDIEVTAAKE